MGTLAADRVSALRVTVAGPTRCTTAREGFSDYWHGRRSAGLRQIEQRSAGGVAQRPVQVRDTQGFFAPLHQAWWKLRSEEHTESAT